MMRKKTAALLATLILASAANAEMLPGSEWGPVEISGEAFEPVAEIFVRFEQDGRFFGNDGCNSIRSAFVTNDDAILFGPAAATMMACPDEIMAQGRAFTNALMAARLFERNGTELSLSDAEGEVLVRLTQRDAD